MCIRDSLCSWSPVGDFRPQLYPLFAHSKYATVWYVECMIIWMCYYCMCYTISIMLPISCRSKLQCAVKMQISLNYFLLSLQPLVLVISIPHFAHLLEVFTVGFYYIFQWFCKTFSIFVGLRARISASSVALREVWSLTSVTDGACLQRNFLSGNVWWIDSSSVVSRFSLGLERLSHEAFFERLCHETNVSASSRSQSLTSNSNL